MDKHRFETILTSAFNSVQQPEGVGHLPDEALYGFERVARDSAKAHATEFAKTGCAPAPGPETAVYYRWTTPEGEKRGLFATTMAILPCGALQFRQDYDGGLRVRVVGPGHWDNLTYNEAALVTLRP